MKYFRYLIVFLILLVTSTAIASDSKVIGHMEPFPEEVLANPITLNCGAVIREFRGPKNIELYSRLNSLCTHAYSNFFKFIEAKNLKVYNTREFHWNLSFLPEDSCYRCLNDEQYRFRFRYVSGHLIGYTDRDIQYAFMSSVQDREFNTTVVHELFHSMSMFYGVYDHHPGGWGAKTAADEKLAQEFTEWLGYGR